MKGYYWHLGDYARDTVGLTALEHGIYRLLLDAYYAREAPLPLDIKECCKLACSTLSKHRQHVQRILAFYFVVTESGYVHKRAERDIARYRNGEPTRLQKRKDTAERKARFNLERRAYYITLKNAGCQLKWNSGMHELKQITERLGLQKQVREAYESIMDDYTRNAVPGAFHAPRKMDASVNDSSANTRNKNAAIPQYPLTIVGTHSVPVPGPSGPETPAANGGAAPAAPAVCVPARKEHPQARTAESVCQAVRRAGVAFVNPRDALLLALLDAGATVADFEVAATQANAAGKPWAYMLGIVRNRMDDASHQAEQVKQAQEGAKTAREAASKAWLDEVLAAGREIALKGERGQP